MGEPGDWCRGPVRGGLVSAVIVIGSWESLKPAPHSFTALPTGGLCDIQGRGESLNRGDPTCV